MKKVVILLGLSLSLESIGMLVPFSSHPMLNIRTFWFSSYKKENEELRKTVSAQSSRIDELCRIIDKQSIQIKNQASQIEMLSSQVENIKKHQQQQLGNIYIRINEL